MLYADTELQERRETMEINLSGKTALVTGATGELGRVIALTLGQCGADVIIHYHQAKLKAEELAGRIRAMGRKSLIVQADVTQAESIRMMKKQIELELAPPDILVNNAVIQYPWKAVLEQPIEDYQSQFASCVLHNVLMTQAFVPAMIEKRWGRVIGINTECAMQCHESQSAYVSGKRGMDGVLRVLAREVGPHQITVNQVAPGWIRSEGSPQDDQPEHQAYKAKVPLQRRGGEQDVANTVAFLASDLAGFITGAYIPVCGGNVMPTI
jgi:3-oxoacyl-[acyl-carrier protein] reductase